MEPAEISKNPRDLRDTKICCWFWALFGTEPLKIAGTCNSPGFQGARQKSFLSFLDFARSVWQLALTHRKILDYSWHSGNFFLGQNCLRQLFVKSQAKMAHISQRTGCAGNGPAQCES